MNAQKIKEYRKENGLTQDEFAKLLGVTKRTVINYEKGEIIPESKVKLLHSIIDENKNTLKEPQAPYKKIPYYDIDATASQIEVFNDYAETPSYQMALPTFTDCDFACNVSGDSMFPRFCSGDIIICKTVNNLNLIQYGEPYLVVTNELSDNLRSIKILRKHRKDNSLIILKPSNPNFDEFEIQKKSIVKLYLIKGKINRGVM